MCYDICVYIFNVRVFVRACGILFNKGYRMNKLRKISNILSCTLLGVFILFAVFLVGSRIIGIDPYIVLSGSMEPDIKTGSLIYVDRLTPEEAGKLQVGDTVTFVVDKSGTRVTHRIYEVVGPLYVKNQYGEIQYDENGDPKIAKDDSGNPIIMYTTYGINNKNDSTESGYTLDGQIGVGNLSSPNVIGKPAVTIPYLGYIAHFLQNPPGKYISLMFCAALIIYTMFSSPKKASEKNANDSDTPKEPKPEEIAADLSDTENELNAPSTKE